MLLGFLFIYVLGGNAPNSIETGHSVLTLVWLYHKGRNVHVYIWSTALQVELSLPCTHTCKLATASQGKVPLHPTPACPQWQPLKVASAESSEQSELTGTQPVALGKDRLSSTMYVL